MLYFTRPLTCYYCPCFQGNARKCMNSLVQRLTPLRKMHVVDFSQHHYSHFTVVLYCSEVILIMPNRQTLLPCTSSSSSVFLLDSTALDWSLFIYPTNPSYLNNIQPLSGTLQKQSTQKCSFISAFTACSISGYLFCTETAPADLIGLTRLFHSDKFSFSS